MLLQVDDAQAFVESDEAKFAIGKAIAQEADVEPALVDVQLSVSGNRRLSETIKSVIRIFPSGFLSGRRLKEAVDVSYTIRIPQALSQSVNVQQMREAFTKVTPEVMTRSVVQNLEALGETSFTVSVQGITEPVVEELAILTTTSFDPNATTSSPVTDDDPAITDTAHADHVRVYQGVLTSFMVLVWRLNVPCQS